eukprot:CAMPEP_0197618636 /NCGR_PEP_ID=MMETSP1326-20131121/61636_1 /TAXON_ID=1155430 /ORGANISM="Genus nov. species nov., Strain RCC2288" /LENGTH=113 /DNA_ID=CAMNT_0043187535 /DNA_START=659 /DNA_END=1000 /DNA_ORIENTATION=+
MIALHGAPRVPLSPPGPPGVLSALRQSSSISRSRCTLSLTQDDVEEPGEREEWEIPGDSGPDVLLPGLTFTTSSPAADTACVVGTVTAADTAGVVGTVTGAGSSSRFEGRFST